jgi:iron complex transport system substrate-binding protein
MTDRDTTRHEAPTRRDTLKYGGTIAAGAVIAGCTGGGEGDATGDTSESTASEIEPPAEDPYYEVCI